MMAIEGPQPKLLHLISWINSTVGAIIGIAVIVIAVVAAILMYHDRDNIKHELDQKTTYAQSFEKVVDSLKQLKSARQGPTFVPGLTEPLLTDQAACQTIFQTAYDFDTTVYRLHIEALVLMKDHRYDEAKKKLSDILTRNRFSPRANYNMACVLTLLAQSKAAGSPRENSLDSAAVYLQRSLECGLVNRLKLIYFDPKALRDSVATDPNLALLMEQRKSVKDLLKTYIREDRSTSTNSFSGVGGCIDVSMRIMLNDGMAIVADSIHIGDEVVCLDSAGHTAIGRVCEIRRHKVSEILRLNGFLVLTAEHPVRTDFGWIGAGDLRLGTFVQTYPPGRLRIQRIDTLQGDFTAIDLQVEPWETFVVEGVVVHNKTSESTNIEK